MRSLPDLPPLQTLRAFDAVGRLLSFRRAGEELLITQSAVSHHIRALEDALNVRLFDRRARGVTLTPEGERYWTTVAEAMSLIAGATAEVRQTAARQRLRVSLLPSFAANWLVPRLDDFRAAHPSIDLQLDPTLRPVDLAAGEADVAVRYGDGGWAGVRRELLTAERLTPVLSPALAAARPLLEPSDLLGTTLLLTQRPFDWEIWAEEVGFDLASARTLQLTDYNIVLQAALDGQGVALGRLLLLEERLRSGTLVAPYSTVVTSARAGYWLLTPERRVRLPAVRLFADWIRDRAARPS